MRILRHPPKFRFWLLLFPLLFAFSLWPHEARDKDRYFEVIKSLDIFASLFKALNSYYVEEPQPMALVEQAIVSMLEELDPYTDYISEREISSYRLQNVSSYASVGLYIDTRPEGYFVRELIAGYSAATEGKIHIGDLLLEINKLPVGNRSLDDIHVLLSGQTGSEVSLKLQRPVSADTYEVVLRREKHNKSSVPNYLLLPDTHIGYVQLSEFDQTASANLQRAIEDLTQTGAQAFLIDLRYNGGGLLNEAVAISNFFVPRGSEIVQARGRKEQWSRTYYAEHEPIDTESPLAVLVNHRTASASEIVCGVIQDYDRGIVIGKKTYGKGLVQTTLPLPYQAQFRVTTARYYTPSGRCIQAIDYSAQNKVAAVSYSNETQRTFYTKNKRPVYDRGGILPDVPIDPTYLSPLLHFLVDSLLVFDYATEYVYLHPAADDSAAEPFSLSPREYLAFEKWLLGQEKLYRMPAHQALQQLSIALQDSTDHALFDTQLATLKNTLNNKLRADLQRYRHEIESLLSREINKRYRRTTTSPYDALTEDPYVQQAQRLLQDTDRYLRLLEGK